MGLFVIFRFLSNDGDLRLKFDTSFQTRSILDSTDQGEDLISRGTTVIDDEVGMDFRNAGTSDGAVLESQFVDEAPCGDAVRVLENTAGTGGHGLSFLAMTKRFDKQVVYLSGVGRCPGERG